MLRKRIIGVVTIKQNWVVQSFGYSEYLPVGKVGCVLVNLDRWGVDEILIQVIDRSKNKLGPDFELLEQIASLGLGTPLTYAGGIRTEQEAIDVIKTGADRICVDALLHDDPNVIREISYRLGAQAVVASMPVMIKDDKYHWFDYRFGKYMDISKEVLELLNNGVVSEILLVDAINDGVFDSFNEGILNVISDSNVPIIVFGGISRPEMMRRLLLKENVSAVSIGNFLNYTEHSFQTYKDQLSDMPIRPPVYLSDYEYRNESN